jgi:UDP-N-acetylglucosamine--N-acetylmuramyl-(pentapeptide) pyrophosphoryl-undecaprenol N-acetylglucosamine transferase
MDEKIIICLTGGATGGHFFPLLSVAKIFQQKFAAEKQQGEIVYVGAPVLDERGLNYLKIAYFPITTAKWRRYWDIRNLFDIFKFPFGLFKAFFILYRLMPNVIFSKGGPGSLQVVLAGWLLRIPILIHESDTIPGKSNRLGAKFANRIALAFGTAKKYFPQNKTAVIGQPIDPFFQSINPTDEDYIKFNLDKTRPIILVIGGSQGSQKINEVVVEALPELLSLAQVVHQTGVTTFEETRLTANGFILENVPLKKGDYHPLAFITHEDLIKLLKACTLVISRAGSGAIFEIAAAGKPSILIPLPQEVAGRHQIENAYAYADTGTAVVLEQENFNKHILTSIVHKLLTDTETQKAMSIAALEFSKPNAAYFIAEELIALMEQ